jgi:hypothetical protein
MKKALWLAGLLVALAVALGIEPVRVAEAAQTCSTACSSGRTLQCTTANGTCTSSAGTVTCCGQTYSCAPIDAAVAARNACLNDCNDDYEACVDDCTVRDPCLTNCSSARTFCRSRCPVVPQTSFSC